MSLFTSGRSSMRAFAVRVDRTRPRGGGGTQADTRHSKEVRDIQSGLQPKPTNEPGMIGTAARRAVRVVP